MTLTTTALAVVVIAAIPVFIVLAAAIGTLGTIPAVLVSTLLTAGFAEVLAVVFLHT